MKIPIILGTGRQGRYSEMVANYILVQAKNYGFASVVIDVRDYADPVTVPNWELQKKDVPWRKILSDADGVIIVVPEYNHSFPGELKIMIDKIDKELTHKPIGLAAVSSGPFGGLRAIESLLPILSYFSAVPINANTNFGNVEKLFNAQGKIQDEAYERRLKKMFTEINWYAKKLKE